MLRIHPYHWPTGRARDGGQRPLGVTVAVVAKQDWYHRRPEYNVQLTAAKRNGDPK